MSLRSFALVALILLPFPAAAADTPRDELLRLVPEKTAVCFIMTGLRDRAKAIADSPFAAWTAARFGPAVTAAPEFAALEQFQKLLVGQIGLSAADLRDDVFGDAVVFAYRPGPPGKLDAEQGVALLKARDAAKLGTLLDKLNQFQTATGELSALKPEVHAGVAYVRRAKADGADEFYLVRGGLFAFAKQESALRAVIDRLTVAPDPAGSAIARSLKTLGADDAFLTVWVNPRPLDADFAAQTAATADPRDKAFRTGVAKIWAATDAVAVFLRASADVEIGVAAAVRPADLPADVRPLFAPPERSAVWDAVPPDALVAVGGRVNVPAVLKALAAFAPADEADGLKNLLEKVVGPVVGRDAVAGFLAGLGPDWGGFATAPAGSGWVPEITLAARTRTAAAERGAGQLAGFYAQLARVQYNQSHDDQVDSRDDDGGTFFGNEKGFPAGFAPGYAVRDSYFIAGSSPAAVRRFAVTTAANPSDAGGVPWLRASGTGLRKYLGTHHAAVAGWLAGVRGGQPAPLAADLKTLAELLEPVDAVELLARGDGNVFGLTLKVKLAKPLTK